MESRIGKTVLFTTLACATLMVGCVSKGTYQRALDANVRANEALKLASEDLGEVQEDKRLLKVELDAAKRVVMQKQQVVDQLQEALAQGNARFEELKQRYERDTRDIGPAPLDAVALPEALDKQLQQWATQYASLVEYDRRRGMVKFKTDLVFASGSDEVSGSARETLDKFASILREDKSGEFHIYIAGHTDDVPIGKPATRRRHPDNWYLSVHRAVGVMRVLAANGVPEKRLAVMGFGEFQPVAENAPNNKGNDLNRRVEIWIVPPDRFMTTTADEEAPKPREEK